MSIVQPPIDLSSVGSSFQVTPPSNLQSENIGWIVLLNESPYTLTFFAGGLQLSIPAWDEYPIQVAKRVNGQIIVTSSFSLPITIQSMLLPTNLPTSQSTQLVVSFFAIGEVPPSTVPRNLNRQTWIPNNVNTVGNNVSNILQNDGNAVPTQFIESTPTGAASSTVSLNNDGTGFIKAFVGGVLKNLIQFIAGTQPTVQFGNTVAIVPQAQQIIATGGTINFTGSVIHVITNGAAATGVIMQPGTVDGQLCYLISDDSAHSITFAAAGSNVGSGSNNQLFQARNMIFVWNATTSLWLNHGGN